MRVLQINSVCGVGSTGRIATDIHKVLVEHGHESLLAYGRETHPSCSHAIRIGDSLSIYGHVLETRLFDRHGLGSAKATQHFCRQIERLAPDVVHLHNIHGYYLNYEILFSYLKTAGKRVVWTLHDCWAFTGHCAYFDYVKCGKWRGGCYLCPQKSTYPASLWLDNSSMNYRRKVAAFSGVPDLTFVTPSNWLASLVKQSFLQPYNVRVINNGIDLDVFAPTPSTFRRTHGLGNKFVILGVASQWSQRKGLSYLLALARTLATDEVIVLVGLSEKQNKELPIGIISIPKTHSVKALAEIYSVADVFVNPTLEDNFPTTNIEALACGTPVITFASGGSGESVGGDCGHVVPTGDLVGLRIAINGTKSAGKLHYSGACRERALLLYDKWTRFADYLIVYTGRGDGT